MKYMTFLTTVCLLGATACSPTPTNDSVTVIQYDPVPRQTLLRGLVRTQNQLLDQLLWDTQRQQADNALRQALTTVYCDLIGRGVVKSDRYKRCADYSSALSRQCSAAYYRRIARLESLHADCAGCVDELQICLSSSPLKRPDDRENDRAK